MNPALGRPVWGRGLIVLLGWMVLTGASGGFAVAAEAATDAEIRLQAMEAELAAIKERLDQSSPTGWGNGSDASACATGQPCTARECYHSGFYAGYAFVFAKPYYKESFQATSLSLSTGQFDLIPFSQDYELTPRFWLGYQSESGLGARGTYWQFDHAGNPLSIVSDLTTIAGASVVSVIFPANIMTTGPNQVLSVSNGLELHTTDLEGTLPMQIGSVSMLGGGGVRIASLEQTFRAAVSPKFQAKSKHNFLRRLPFGAFGNSSY